MKTPRDTVKKIKRRKRALSLPTKSECKAINAAADKFLNTFNRRK